MMKCIRRIVLSVLSILLLSTGILSQDFKKQVIYQIVTDRFYNGDTTNDNPPQSSGLFDSTQTNWHLYWGGDLAGITAKMSYLQGLGVTAIWISPPVDNLNLNIPDSNNNPTASYHGYGARDFMRIEEHFGSSANDWTAFNNMVTAAHNAGIKVIVDFARTTPIPTVLANTDRFTTTAPSSRLATMIRTVSSITTRISPISTTATSCSTTPWKVCAT